MNRQHLEYCASDDWADALRKWMIPPAVDGLVLGDHVLEIGPGPGRTTDILRQMAPRLTAVEMDRALASSLAARMSGTNVTVVEADAAAMPFADATFSAALCFTMMHHVPTLEAQDRLLGETRRVLRAGATLAGVDSLDSEEFRRMHVDDVCNPLDPATLAARLERAGFSAVRVEPNAYVLHFWARA